MHDDAPEQDPVLGVFSTEGEASDFAKEVAPRFPEKSVFWGKYEPGWRYDAGSSQYKSR